MPMWIDECGMSLDLEALDRRNQFDARNSPIVIRQSPARGDGS